MYWVCLCTCSRTFYLLVRGKDWPINRYKTPWSTLRNHIPKQFSFLRSAFWFCALTWFPTRSYTIWWYFLPQMSQLSSNLRQKRWNNSQNSCIIPSSIFFIHWTNDKTFQYSSCWVKYRWSCSIVWYFSSW